IGLRAGQRHGYAHGFGYAAIGLLLADHVGAGILAFGSVMEQVFLRSGNVYTDVVRAQASSFNTLGRTLRTAGLELALPTGGCSEVITERVAATGRYAGLAISCPRPGPRGEPCGTCFKCFRKLRLEGVANLPEPDGQVLKVLDTYPLKSATSVVFASQRAGYSYPSIERYLDADLGFLERYYGYAIEHMLPVHLRGPVQAELAALGIRQMSSSDEHDLRSVARVFWPEKFRP
ncbi:MAG: DUF6395 domain-containing protein, partial [Jiangellaceae bacterium]